ncbi:DMT family transporter [Paenibacillus nasutitermitis]|uniref:EamA family transporter n=1 Tax=Paenibacillus nasutitermitis TaxID=1652958 RepID=A0A916YYI6_9BACL|nr:DMT family transporter [Paenibacillus nasutitermitis]GGD65896.1 EamA family transporter [Paenibacillus nasutitermitis]
MEKKLILNDTPLYRQHTGKAAVSGIWLVAAGAALWGMDPLFRILLLKSLTSSQIVFAEHLLLMVFAIPILLIHRSELAGLNMRQLGALLFIGWGGSAIATVLFTSAFVAGDPNTVLLIQKTQPLFTIFIARLVLRESLPPRFSWLILLALAGTYLITFGLSTPIGHWHNIWTGGSLLSLGAAALWGGSTVMGRLLLDRMSFVTVTALRFVVALPLLLALTLSEGAQWHIPSEVGAFAAVTANLLLQAFLPGLASLLFYYRGLSRTKASYATLAELSFPAVGLIVNWLVFSQPLTIVQFAGFILIWVTLLLLSRQTKSAA